MRLTRQASALRQKLMTRLAHDLRVTVPQLRDDGLAAPVSPQEATAYPYEVECWEDLIWYAQCPMLGLHATGWSMHEATSGVRQQIADIFGVPAARVRLSVNGGNDDTTGPDSH